MVAAATIAAEREEEKGKINPYFRWKMIRKKEKKREKVWKRSKKHLNRIERIKNGGFGILTPVLSANGDFAPPFWVV